MPRCGWKGCEMSANENACFEAHVLRVGLSAMLSAAFEHQAELEVAASEILAAVRLMSADMQARNRLAVNTAIEIANAVEVVAGYLRSFQLKDATGAMIINGSEVDAIARGITQE